MPAHPRIFKARLSHCAGELSHCVGELSHCAGELSHLAGELSHCAGLAPAGREKAVVAATGAVPCAPADRWPRLLLRSQSAPLCMCIRMTAGSFVDYNDSCLLHCGISDSAGRVHNFDERGARQSRYRISSVPAEFSMQY
jgi:hypothetical protein